MEIVVVDNYGKSIPKNSAKATLIYVLKGAQNVYNGTLPEGTTPKMPRSLEGEDTGLEYSLSLFKLL